MAYAHQGIELRQVAGLGKNGAAVGPILDKDGKGDAPIRPAMLTHKGVQTLLRVEQLMDEAGRQMSARGPVEQSRPPTTGEQTPAPARPPVPEKLGGKAGDRVGSVAAAAQ
jgi:penicillin-binding protein 1A